jgi:hypothetical protein
VREHKTPAYLIDKEPKGHHLLAVIVVAAIGSFLGLAAGGAVIYFIIHYCL